MKKFFTVLRVLLLWDPMQNQRFQYMNLTNSIFFSEVQLGHRERSQDTRHLHIHCISLPQLSPRKHCVYEVLQSLRPEDLPTLKLRGTGDATKFQLFDEFHPNFATHQAIGRNLAELLEGKLKGN